MYSEGFKGRDVILECGDVAVVREDGMGGYMLQRLTSPLMRLSYGPKPFGLEKKGVLNLEFWIWTGFWMIEDYFYELLKVIKSDSD